MRRTEAHVSSLFFLMWWKAKEHEQKTVLAGWFIINRSLIIFNPTYDSWCFSLVKNNITSGAFYRRVFGVPFNISHIFYCRKRKNKLSFYIVIQTNNKIMFLDRIGATELKHLLDNIKEFLDRWSRWCRFSHTRIKHLNWYTWSLVEVVTQLADKLLDIFHFVQKQLFMNEASKADWISSRDRLFIRQ